MKPKTHRFNAKVIKIDINPCVDVSNRIVTDLLAQAGKKTGPVTVRGKLNGTPFQTTVVKFRGKWRLYLNGDMRERSDTDVGDRVRIELGYDAKPPEVPMPKKLTAAFAKNASARRAFESLSPSHQKEILRYLNYLKSEDSLDRNIRKLIEKELKQ